MVLRARTCATHKQFTMQAVAVAIVKAREESRVRIADLNVLYRHQ